MAKRHRTYVHSAQQSRVLIRKPFRDRRDPKRPIPGQRSGRLTVLEYVGHDHHGQSHWKCRCDCGKEIVVSAASLRPSGRGRKTRSCGCLNRERLAENWLVHGDARASGKAVEFRCWLSMRFRCRHILDYVERGITVCPEWESSYAAFLRDMGRAPVDGQRYTLDRIDNARGYEPGNVRWATYREQSRNKSDNRLLTFCGETKCLQDWADQLGLHPNTIRRRLSRGLSVEDSLLLPVPRKGIVPDPAWWERRREETKRRLAAVKDKRLALGLSGWELARLAGLSGDFYYRVERGKSRCRAEYLEYVEAFLDSYEKGQSFGLPLFDLPQEPA